MANIGLFVPCLINTAFPQVAMGLAELLEALGYHVVVPLQSCCGQPAYNAGYTREATLYAKEWLKRFRSLRVDAIVAPSGSCVSMVKKHYSQLPLPESLKEAHQNLMPRIYEATAFLFPHLKDKPLKLSTPFKGVYHPSCHLYYDLRIHQDPLTLLQKTENLMLVHGDLPPRCCGFGGLFSIKHPDLSAMMGKIRLKELLTEPVDGVITSDAGCLSHLQGIHQMEDHPINFYHTVFLLHHAFFHLSLS